MKDGTSACMPRVVRLVLQLLRFNLGDHGFKNVSSVWRPHPNAGTQTLDLSSAQAGRRGAYLQVPRKLAFCLDQDETEASKRQDFHGSLSCNSLGPSVQEPTYFLAFTMARNSGLELPGPEEVSVGARPSR